MLNYQLNGPQIEKKVLDIILDHTRIVSNATKTLSQLVDFWITTDRENLEKNFKKIDSLEANANKIKKSALMELSKAGPVLLFRQELMRIIHSVERMIDLAQGAAFFLEEINHDWIPPENIIKMIQEITKKMLNVSELLLDLIRALFQSLDNVQRISEKIEIEETRADADYRTLIFLLAKLEAPSGVAAILREAVDRIEDIIDAARDAASFIRIYAMSR